MFRQAPDDGKKMLTYNRTSGCWQRACVCLFDHVKEVMPAPEIFAKFETCHNVKHSECEREEALWQCRNYLTCRNRQFWMQHTARADQLDWRTRVVHELEIGKSNRLSVRTLDFTCMFLHVSVRFFLFICVRSRENRWVGKDKHGNSTMCASLKVDQAKRPKLLF